MPFKDIRQRRVPRGRNTPRQVLERLYYDPDSPAAFTTVEPLYRAARRRGLTLTRQAVRDWLKTQDTYTLHRPARRRYPRNRVIVGGIDSQWQADLVDMIALSKDNDGYRYILTCIDILSKYAWVMPVRTKTGANLIEAFKTIFATGRRPTQLQTDEGTEFLNKPFQQFLAQEKVLFFQTWNETKA